MKREVNSFFKNILSENYLGPLDIESIVDVEADEEGNKMSIKFKTLDGREPTILVKYEDFCNWIADNQGDLKDIFKKFLVAFFTDAQPAEDKGLSEIIDNDDNIMANEDKPNNATDTMVGSSKWDLEKFAQHGLPKTSAFYTGSFANGFVVW